MRYPACHSHPTRGYCCGEGGRSRDQRHNPQNPGFYVPDPADVGMSAGICWRVHGEYVNEAAEGIPVLLRTLFDAATKAGAAVCIAGATTLPAK